MMVVDKITRREALRLGASGAAGFALLAVSGGAWAQGRTLRFVATGTFAPFNMVTDDGRITGIYAEALSEIGKQIGFAVDYRPIPWARAQKMVEDGEADGFVTLPTEARRKYALFTSKPLISVESPLLVTVKGAPVATELKAATSAADLAKFRIGDYRGNSFGEAIHKDWENRQIVTDIPGVLKILDAGRIDYTLQIKEVVQYFAKQAGLSDRFDYTPLTFLADQTQHFHIAIRASLPDAEKLIADIETTQERLRTDTVIDKMVKQYV